jgi:hypothetical protein
MPELFDNWLFEAKKTTQLFTALANESLPDPLQRVSPFGLSCGDGQSAFFDVASTGAQKSGAGKISSPN